MTLTTATTERAVRLSSRRALVGLEPKRQLGMPLPGRADSHVRRPFVSNPYLSRGSAAV